MRIRTRFPVVRAQLSAAFIFVVLAGCGKDGLPNEPVFLLDRETVTFGQEFGTATLVGQRPQESLLIENGGLQPLTLGNANYLGDDVFTVDGPAKLELKGKEHTFVRIIFAPRESKDYAGIIRLTSNDPKAKEKQIEVRGKGLVAPDAGSGDGGP